MFVEKFELKYWNYKNRLQTIFSHPDDDDDDDDDDDGDDGEDDDDD